MIDLAGVLQRLYIWSSMFVLGNVLRLRKSSIGLFLGRYLNDR